jgi:predicted nucleic acid-binding protein
LKIFLDSTYLFPALDVDITEGWSKADLESILKSDYSLFYSDISLFEIYTKCMKLILQEKLAINVNSVQNGIQSILNSTNLHMLKWWENLYESEIVLKLKDLHNDSIDCMLFYLAIVNCDIFATFDETFIENIKSEALIMNFIIESNPNFRIWLKDLSHDPVFFTELEKN